MKDVIEEQRQLLLKETKPLWNSESESDRKLAAAIDYSVRECFQRIQVEADFLINRMQGDAGLIERAATKLPSVGDMLQRYAELLRGYAARLESSQAPEVGPNRSKIITLDGNGS